MFPFNLTGPEFLVFYLGLAIAAAWLAWFLRQRWDPPAVAGAWIDDPYLLAFLRGGRGHLLRVAILSLIDRDLLEVRGTAMRTAGADSVNKVQRPLDQAILVGYLSPGKAGDIFKNQHVLEVAAEYEQQLIDLRLVPDESLRNRRKQLAVMIALPLLAVAVTKINVAVTLGHFNIGFLIVLGIVSTIVICLLSNPFRTRAGNEAQSRAEALFAGLKSRGKSLGLRSPTNELVLLAAVYGMEALPDSVVGLMKPINMHRDTAVGSSCGSSCGGSCGGGCGGGCGGCGG